MSESRNLQERRRYPRVKVTYPALCTTNDSGIHRQAIAMGRVLDISPGGIKMEVYPVARVGTDMPLRVVIQDAALDVPGRVVYSSSKVDQKRLLGIKFDEPVKYLFVDA